MRRKTAVTIAHTVEPREFVVRIAQLDTAFERRPQLRSAIAVSCEHELHQFMLTLYRSQSSASLRRLTLDC
jgi:hypothetical protein